MWKTALVTGASSWIGSACAEYLAMEGFDLILIARRQERLNEIQKDLYETYGTLVEEMAYPWGHAYGGTKAYVNQFSKNLRIDFLWTWVRVTDIAPGKVNTEFSTVRFKGDKKKADLEYVWYEELQAGDIASSVLHCVTSPPHVNIDYMMINSTDWARPGFANIHK